MLLYTTRLPPTWTYATETWGNAKPSIIRRFPFLQSRILGELVDAPFYVTDKTIHTDLEKPLVQSRYLNSRHMFTEIPSWMPTPQEQSLNNVGWGEHGPETY